MAEPAIPRFAADFPLEAVLHDYLDPESGVRALVVRGPLSFCAYVGVRDSHPLAGVEELNAHIRGLNWQSPGQAGTVWPEGWYWWGWDYAHAGSVVDLEGLTPSDLPESLRAPLRELQAKVFSGFGRPLKNWTLGEVVEDALDVVMELRRLMEENEGIAAQLLFSCPRDKRL